MTTTTKTTTYTTKAYAMGNVSITAGDTATITKTYATKWGIYYDVQTAHHGMLNVHEDVLDLILSAN